MVYDNMRVAIKKFVGREKLQVDLESLQPHINEIGCFEMESYKVDKWSTICMNKVHYSVPDYLVGKYVDIKIYSEKIVVFYGNPGTGKTHISIALGIKACLEGYSVLFTSVPHLLTQIRECRSQRTLRALELKFERYDMVICDEFGYISCDKEGGELLFNHLSLRAGRKATIITTNLSFDRWGEIVKDKVLVSAMVDRLTHKAYLINMTGQSYRVKETQKIKTKIVANINFFSLLCKPSWWPLFQLLYTSNRGERALSRHYVDCGNPFQRSYQ